MGVGRFTQVQLVRKKKTPKVFICLHIEIDLKFLKKQIFKQSAFFILWISVATAATQLERVQVPRKFLADHITQVIIKFLLRS